MQYFSVLNLFFRYDAFFLRLIFLTTDIFLGFCYYYLPKILTAQNIYREWHYSDSLDVLHTILIQCHEIISCEVDFLLYSFPTLPSIIWKLNCGVLWEKGPDCRYGVTASVIICEKFRVKWDFSELSSSKT